MKADALPNPSSRPVKSLILGTGEMAELTRGFDWAATPVGPVEQWPDTLLNTVNIILQSRHPMFLWWGIELVQFYNDAYRPSIAEDKHPKALGQKGRECWPEVWHIIGPQIEAVMTRGDASWHEDHLVPILRNGVLDEVYWTYGYSPVCNRAGEIRGVLVICTETTASVLARRQSQREMARLAALFDQAPVFFAVLDGPEFVFEFVNQRYQDLIGQRSVLGKSVQQAVPEAEAQGFIGVLQKVYNTAEPFVGRSTPIQLARGDSPALELRYLDFVYQPRIEPDGSVSGIIVVGIDVTEKKRTEEMLLQSEKLNAVGRLASSIAHEINNPLEAVTNLIYLAQHCAVNLDAKKHLQAAEIELKRVGVITSQTLRFYRQSTKPTPTSASELIDITLPLFQARLHKSHITVERRDRTGLRVTCFDGEIRQVLSNLITNAIDAMHATGGRLLIRSREATDWRTGGRSIVITIADTGTGMPTATRSRIFEPFFTTKEERGTGLGLWISQEIAIRHRGALRVRSSQSPGASGTVFTLSMPADAP